MQNKSLGKRIRQYRENAKVSQELLAEKVGISVTSISNIERGRNYPKMEIFIKIANELCVSPDLLLCDIVDAALDTKATELSRMLSAASPSTQKHIYYLVETLLKENIGEDDLHSVV